MGLLRALITILDGLIGPTVMLVYPLIASLQAIESSSTLNDKQWLTYWILHSFITLFELTFYKVLVWFPVWPYIKILVCIWLVLPVFNGAAYIYENYVRKHAKTIIGLETHPTDMGVLAVIAKRLDALFGPGVMLLYPLYASLRAIETPSMLDDQQWLTYWIIYSLITLFELSFWKILAWLPFWTYIKLLFCMWLVLPIFNGAAYIYENFVRKYVKNIGGGLGSNYTEDQKKLLQMMSLDARKSVVQYADRYGWDAVQQIMKAAEKEVKKRS